MDWKAISNYVLLAGLFLAMLTMFNQVNGWLDSMQAEMNRRFDTLQAENQRQHDAMQEVLRVFEGRQLRASKKKPVLTPETPNRGLLFRRVSGYGEDHFRPPHRGVGGDLAP